MIGNQQQQQQQQQQIKVNLNDADDVFCDECSNAYFTPAVMVKRLSPLLSPTGQEALVPVQLLQCNKCGHINKEFMPVSAGDETANATSE